MMSVQKLHVRSVTSSAGNSKSTSSVCLVYGTAVQGSHRRKRQGINICCHLPLKAGVKYTIRVQRDPEIIGTSPAGTINQLQIISQERQKKRDDYRKLC